MGRHPAESFLDYKRRVLDNLSPSFCGAKWYNATLWLGTGQTSSCHHPLSHAINREEVLRNPRALHNTRHKKEMRALMQRGQRPPECEYCWKMEDLTRDNVSDRVFKSEIYDDRDLAAVFGAPADTDVNPKTLEIAFDRTCNFACSYCNSSFSSKWASDILRNGPYSGLGSDGSGAFRSASADAESFSAGENPYVAAFWKWWPELSRDLQELRITGGEPLLNKNTWSFFDHFERQRDAGMILAVNSNLGVDDEYIDRLIEKSRHVRRLRLFTSCEAVGGQAEYIRDGLNFEKWKANLEKVLATARLESCRVMMTVNALSLFSLTDFLLQMTDMKTRYPKQNFGVSVNILRFPSFQSVLTLPFEIRVQKSGELQEWIAAHGAVLSPHESAGLRRLVSYLRAENDLPHESASPLSLRQKDFRSFYEQYDRRRGKNLAETFPAELVEWYKTL